MKSASRLLLRVILVTAGAMLVALAVSRAEWHEALEESYADRWHVLAGVRYSPRHTAVVAVDDETLAALRDDPLAFWAPHFGRAIDVLRQAGVAAIGLDFLYQVGAEGWLRKLQLPDNEVSRNYDAPLRAALASGRVVLITQLVPLKEGIELLAPPADQLAALPRGIHDLGVANLFPDDDKHVRRFFPSVDPAADRPGLSLGLQLALRVANQDPAGAAWELGGRRVSRQPERLRIGFAGPPGTVPSLSMKSLLAPQAVQDPAVAALKGKAVILAAANAGTPDRHFTPYARGASAELMTGGEVHANVVETLLTGRVPRDVPASAVLAYLAALLAFTSWAFMRLSVARGAALAVAACTAVAVPGYLLLAADWILPVATPQTGLLAAYLLTLGWRLTGEERERARIREMFGRYVSDEVVEKLLADERRPDMAGEALEVTVLFSDIRGFTTISEKLLAREVVEMLNAYFTRACGPILAQGGTVDKYIGDAVMAVFGSPVRHPDHARRAVRAALGLAREAEAFRQWMRERFPDRGLAEFGVGVGLHTGEAVIGDIGTPKRKEFTAIGDTVNAASRLEGVTRRLDWVIVASEATLKAAGPGVRTGRFEQVTVKGRAQPLAVHEMLGLDDESEETPC